MNKKLESTKKKTLKAGNLLFIFLAVILFCSFMPLFSGNAQAASGLYADKYKVTDKGRSITIGKLHYPKCSKMKGEVWIGVTAFGSGFDKYVYNGAYEYWDTIKNPKKSGYLKNIKIRFAKNSSKLSGLKPGKIKYLKIEIDPDKGKSLSVKQKVKTLNVKFDPVYPFYGDSPY